MNSSHRTRIFRTVRVYVVSSAISWLLDQRLRSAFPGFSEWLESVKALRGVISPITVAGPLRILTGFPRSTRGSIVKTAGLRSSR